MEKQKRQKPSRQQLNKNLYVDNNIDFDLMISIIDTQKEVEKYIKEKVINNEVISEPLIKSYKFIK
jgi:hypothetical protein